MLRTLKKFCASRFRSFAIELIALKKLSGAKCESCLEDRDGRKSHGTRGSKRGCGMRSPTSGNTVRKWGTRSQVRALHQLVELVLIRVVVEFARAPKRDLIP